MIVTTLFIAVVFLLAIAVVVWQETSFSNSLIDRTSSKSDDYVQPEFIFEKLDAKIAEHRQKRISDKYSKPKLSDLFRRLVIYNILVLFYLYFKKKLFIDNWPEVTVYVVISSILVISFHYFALVPDYYKKIDENLPRYIQLFSQEITYCNQLNIALTNTKNYAHPEFSRICLSIAKMQSLGMGLEQAIRKVLPEVKNEGLLLFLAALLIHDRAGGRLNFVIKNLAELFQKQNNLHANIERVVMTSKLALFGGSLLIPLFFFILNYLKPQETKLFWTNPTGIYCSKIIIGMYLLNLFLGIYVMKSEKL